MAFWNKKKEPEYKPTSLDMLLEKELSDISNWTVTEYKIEHRTIEGLDVRSYGAVYHDNSLVEVSGYVKQKVIDLANSLYDLEDLDRKTKECLQTAGLINVLLESQKRGPNEPE